ncbi:MAG TPA: hypothetical protein VEV15_10350, partial [Flavisolibacter sp.]|nr:hypothetical protein [Flavisolibacter sp.]
RKNIFIIHLFLFTGLSLINELVNELDFSVNKILDNGQDKKIAAAEDENKSNQPLLPIFLQNKNAQANRYGKDQCRKSGKLAGRKIFFINHDDLLVQISDKRKRDGKVKPARQALIG